MDPALETASPDSNGNKRKSEGGDSQRTKRNRYISIACNECKRRKIKCNGNTPCQRCGNLNLECVYAPNCCGSSFKDSDEHRQMTAQIASLQEQVDSLFANLSSLRSDLAASHPPIDPSLQNDSYLSNRASIPAPPAAPMLSPVHSRTKSQSLPKQPAFRGPTSSDFGFDVAKSSLQTMGITPHGQGIDEGVMTADPTPSHSPRVTLHPSKDPIYSVSRSEALRLLRVYEQESHEMYPVISISHMTAHIGSLYNFIEAMIRNGIMQQGFPGADALNDGDTIVLKLVLAIAITIEDSGPSELGKRLFGSVQPSIDALLRGDAFIKDVRILALTATYEFYVDNEGASWRVIGLTARLCFELGLHRKTTYDAMPENERESSLLLFWAVYTLDRRWSFGTGMPFALQDSDIDPTLGRPAPEYAYLNAAIEFCAISGKVWRTVGVETGGTEVVTREDIGYLDYQIIQWHRSLPEQLRYNHPSMGQQEDNEATKINFRHRVVLYLRANNMRINIHRPVLHSATSTLNNRAQAQTVIDVAKDTIRVLTHLHQTSTLYRTSQSLFNPFLTSALAVLFLAVSHTPALFAEQVREEFYMALELVRGFSRGSWVSKRLWKTIRILKEVGPKLGLVAARTNHNEAHHGAGRSQEDPSRSAAVAMAGLAGHNVDELALYGVSLNDKQSQHWPLGNASLASNSPDNMANDLTTLFEAAGNYGNSGYNGGIDVGFNGTTSVSNGPYPMSTPPASLGEGQTHGMEIGAFGGEDELSRIMRDLF